ncbi:hypothetical protein DFH09DRAFT_1325595 [Mycena vulgaris]|nr:hypothetical protein DFH09DRAFT_1325595 [Mycena vulgaris]
MKHIIESRIPDVGEDVLNLMSINDIQNGMLVSNNLHPLIDGKKMAVIKTPNRVLACDDIPPRRNTLTGVAALKWWNKGLAQLLTACQMRPAPLAAPLGPSRSKGDRSDTAGELADARRNVEGLQGSSEAQDDIDQHRQLETEQHTPAARRRHAEQQEEHKDRMAH